MVWNLENAEPVTTTETFSRFRITTDPGSGFFDSSGPAPFGIAEDGEVEDHRVPADTLPVSISAFESAVSKRGLDVSWTTVSETENIGFYIWADTGKNFELLTEKMIPSTATMRWASIIIQ